MIILCKNCHTKNGEEIFDLIKNSNSQNKVATDIKILQEEVRILRNQLAAAHRWVVRLTQDKEKNGVEICDEKKSESGNPYGCECCWALHRS
jgi:hypothetical protein